VKVRERLRRWWKPGEYDDESRVPDDEGHPLSAEERDERRPVSFQDERGKLDGYTVGGGALDPDREFRPPR
jgi:hypothetical protein